jgi:S1-C subfamily serine protease
VPYEVKWVDQDRQAAIEMVRRSGQQGVPVIVIDDQVVVGFNKPRLEQLLAHRRSTAPGAETAPRPNLGAQVADAATIMVKQGNPALMGAYVGGVRSGSPADQAGLRSGDIITAVNDRLVRVADDLARNLATLSPGAMPTLTVLRDGARRQVPVRWEAAPSTNGAPSPAG